MKLGIITFQRALNYGAFLQAFSLYSYLQSQGNQVEIVDYWPKEHEEAYKLFSIQAVKNKSISFKIKYFIHFVLKCTRSKKRKKKMETLQSEYLHLSKHIKYPNSNSLQNIKFDYLIYGSDQIWWKSTYNNKKIFDWTYWGEYVPKSIKKISYAASMGVIDTTSFDKDEISQKLKNFSSISVRENQLKSFIQPLTKTTVLQTIDPVFLKSKEEWSHYAKDPKISKKYVLLFNLMRSKEAEIVAKAKAKELQCDLLEITPSVLPLKIGRKIYQTLDAFEFIGFIKKAEFIVTSSFHGTAFSIIFEKQFYSTGMKNNSGRVSSLLTSLNIQDRLLKQPTEMTKNFVNYDSISIKKNILVNISKNFLANALM